MDIIDYKTLMEMDDEGFYDYLYIHRKNNRKLLPLKTVKEVNSKYFFNLVIRNDKEDFPLVLNIDYIHIPFGILAYTEPSFLTEEEVSGGLKYLSDDYIESVNSNKDFIESQIKDIKKRTEKYSSVKNISQLTDENEYYERYKEYLDEYIYYGKKLHDVKKYVKLEKENVSIEELKKVINEIGVKKFEETCIFIYMKEKPELNFLPLLNFLEEYYKKEEVESILSRYLEYTHSCNLMSDDFKVDFCY